MAPRPTPDVSADRAEPPCGLQVITTVGSETDAQRIAAALLERRLAACVQIDGPIRSHYRWQGKVAVDAEWRLVIKTLRSRWDAVQQALLQLHPYELPEIIGVRLERCSPAYLGWMAEQVAADQAAS